MNWEWDVFGGRMFLVNYPVGAAQPTMWRRTITKFLMGSKWRKIDIVTWPATSTTLLEGPWG